MITEVYDVFLSLFQYIKDSIRYYSESLAKYHLIYGLGSLFYISLPVHLESTLPECFQTIIKVCYDSDLDNNDEPCSNINHVEVTLNIQSSDLENEKDSDYDDEDDDFPFGTEPIEYYDSLIETADHVEYIKNLFNDISTNSPLLKAKILKILNQHDVRILNSILRHKL